MMHVFATLKPEQVLEVGKEAYAQTSAHVLGAPAVEPREER
jgi:hypothetical protein